jgi:hypothetical protein
MKEDFLQYVWKFQLFNSPTVTCTDGQELSVLFPGIHNRRSGPDFMNARLRIGKTLWAGHVEVHIRASDWHRHGHQHDAHYHHIILHVVLENDQDIKLPDGTTLPVLELKKYIRVDQFATYQLWMRSNQWIPCASSAALVDAETWQWWKERLLIERMEIKYLEIKKMFDTTAGDWSDVAYLRLLKVMGRKHHDTGMELLGEMLPYAVARRYTTELFQAEALLFGVAGLLPENDTDEYAQKLKDEFSFLAHKHRLHAMKPEVWHFGGTRPHGFPTMKLAQCAAILCSTQDVFSMLLNIPEDELVQHFRQKLSPYWSAHFRFRSAEGEEKGHTQQRQIGLDTAESLVINLAVPILFSYGKAKADEQWIDKALRLLDLCHRESNTVVNNWRKEGLCTASARDTQPLLHLHRYYCNVKRCLSCGIGIKLLKEENT